ncbi:MAG: glucosaminidase domain-containing protein [Treponema sp.]|jgi:hypothetical protein|nr:glucosaminidase domain-containing protein [Treponema sp.]
MTVTLLPAPKGALKILKTLKILKAPGALFAGALAGICLFSSCAGMSYSRAGEIPELPQAVPERGMPVITERAVPESPPEQPETPIRPIPAIPFRILGAGLVAPEALSGFLLSVNPGAGENFSAELANFYAEEADIEGVNHDVAFAQMCLETGFLRYGNLVTADMNNFCGLGAIGEEQRGERFDEPRIGVRAHIQHLKAYATEEPPRQDLVDPRYRWVRYGSAPTIYGLAGTWAADREYAEKIKDVLEMLYTFVYTGRLW